MWKFIIIFIISLSAFDNAFAGQPDGIGKFIVTDINDKDSTLNKEECSLLNFTESETEDV